MSSSRHGSSSSEIMENMVLLQDELAKSKMETQRVNNQLACLISLVRKAWTGDREAAVHVANIVGVAPPDLSLEDIDESKVALTAKPKPAALNNWARLTIGLLNREYKYLEDNQEIHQQQYLEDRNYYLDDQMYKHHMMIQRPRSGHNVYDDVVERIMRHQRPSTATACSIERPKSGTVKKTKGVIGHLYKPPDNHTHTHTNHDITLGDLFINGGKSPSHDTNVKLFEYRLPKTMSNQNGTVSQEEPQSRYDDPDRYAKVDLFALDSMLSEGVNNRIKTSDAKRSRPKSSVITRPKSGRPLKYETTRPLSSNPRNHVHFKPDLEIDMNNSSRPPTAASVRKPRVQSAFIRRPNHVDDFQRDQEELSMMEDQFRRTALQLQKKLGIRTNGFV